MHDCTYWKISCLFSQCAKLPLLMGTSRGERQQSRTGLGLWWLAKNVAPGPPLIQVTPLPFRKVWLRHWYPSALCFLPQLLLHSILFSSFYWFLHFWIFIMHDVPSVYLSSGLQLRQFHLNLRHKNKVDTVINVYGTYHESEYVLACWIMHGGGS